MDPGSGYPANPGYDTRPESFQHVLAPLVRDRGRHQILSNTIMMVSRIIFYTIYDLFNHPIAAQLSINII
jgi:hypothetical protein